MNGSNPGEREKGTGVAGNPRILVIDDEQVIRDSARRILTAEGFPVLVASDAESALQILKTDPQDIAICDLMLPGLSGLEFLEASQRDDPSLVVIITTGYATVDHGVDSLRKGAFDFLPKPFTFEELVSQVDRASRFANLPIAVRVEAPPADFAGCHFLGSQTWARPDVDGSWLLGLAAMLLRTIGPIRCVDFPEAGGELQQGGLLVAIATEDDLVHNVRSPLSGEILQINDRLRKTPDLPHQDPVTNGWLLRILPAHLEQETPALTAADMQHRFS